MLKLSLLLAAAAGAAALSGPQPQTMGELECAVAQFAFNLASTKVNNTGAVYDALNVAYLCANYTKTAAVIALQFSEGLEREALRIRAQRTAWELASGAPKAEATTYFVATTGNDGNSGTIDAPFATVQRAAAAARSVTPRSPGDVVVYLRAGTYYLGDAPLALTEADSNVTWSAYPGDAAVGPVILSGARLLTGLTWSPYKGAGILTAPVSIKDSRREAWAAAHPGWTGAGPAPLVQSLFVDGTRQVRARFPNGNPQDLSGICFSATQRPGEMCRGYSACAMSSTGNQPAPPAAATIQHATPDRGSSPTQGCPQCGDFNGGFEYGIFPPPSDHPVYTSPMPGYTPQWPNTSVFSYWGSPFDRPAGVNVNTVNCDGGHWSGLSYANNGTDAVVHMYHPGLWGGWMYAVDSVTTPQPGDEGEEQHSRAEFRQEEEEEAVVAAPPAGMSLWLRADDLQGPSGSAVSSWPDASGQNHAAAQAQANLQPTLQTSCFGSLPCVSFDGSQWLHNGDLPLPGSGSTMFAVVQDTGSDTTYGSGVFYSLGGMNGIGTKSSDAVAANDDDPAPVGTTIRVLMLDWAGSPADPGHRDISARPSILGATFSPSATNGFVDGCLELQDGGHAAGGMGYEVGTRNAEMGRYLKGHIGEILVYPFAMNTTQRAAVNSYLSSKWGTPVPKHCASPSSNSIAINFGYGGFQEARGGSIHPGQSFYIENVLEELDVPGEWYYDPSAGQLYVWPNGTTDLTTATLAVPLADQIVSIKGNSTGSGVYATGISLVGLTFTQSRPTFLEQYEVPSGGDWALHRGAAVFVQDAEGVSIHSCAFNQTGGNGVMFSNHVTGSSITAGEFVYTGDSAVVFVGSTNLADGSGPSYPNGNTVSMNHIHEWGTYGKQTSCFAQQLSANSTITDNVCYNGPRAGINYNDGFGGGHVFARNVVFNSVRETGDHGPLNSWDRQPYWTASGVDDGFSPSIKPSNNAALSLIKAWDVNEQNLMINGYNGVWSYDHDDGSQFVADTSSFLVWGGCKNYLGHTKNCSGNVILYPGIDGRSAGNRRCQTDDNGVFANQYHEGNVCTAADGQFYSFSGCSTSNVNTTTYHTSRNTLYADPGSAFNQGCGQNLDFASWQGLGQDAGSSTAITPNVTALIAMGAAVLGL